MLRFDNNIWHPILRVHALIGASPIIDDLLSADYFHFISRKTATASSAVGTATHPHAAPLNITPGLVFGAITNGLPHLLGLATFTAGRPLIERECFCKLNFGRRDRRKRTGRGVSVMALVLDNLQQFFGSIGEPC